MDLFWADRLGFRESQEMELSWADRLAFRVSRNGAVLGRPPGFQRVSRNGAVLGGSPSISLLPMFWQLVAPTPISLNDGLSFNNNNNNNDFLIVWNILIQINFKIFFQSFFKC